MIKILIADDESFTREGIKEMVNWEKLNISEIREAYDGVNALEILEDYEPNILLTDVKMPRLDGINLAFKTRELYPNCIILFMSGYSDKEYLKSAIKLKAINYVEKPIEIDELEESLNTAVIEFSKNNVIQNSIEKNFINDISTIKDPKTIDSIINSYFPKGFNEKISTSFYVTVLVRTIESIQDNSTNCINEIKSIIHLYNFDGFVSLEKDHEITIQLFFSKNITSINNSKIFSSFFVSLDEYLKTFTKYYIYVGSIVHDIKDMYISYSDAVQLRDRSFFKDYNSIIFNDNCTKNFTFDTNIYEDFDLSLKNEDKQNLIKIINNLTYSILLSSNAEVSYIKDIYYKMLLKIINYSKNKNLDISKYINDNNVFDIVMSFNNIYEIKHYLLDKIDELFIALNEKNQCNEPALKIIKYIHNNYSNYDLSLDDISKNTFLTPAYICVIFKDYTGKTVNKYISEHRIKKAKELIKNPDIKMSDIAQEVGFRDGNYFAKIFKKETGCSPTEYRRKYL